MKRGVRFLIPDRNSSNHSLGDILKPIPCPLYKWAIGCTEIHLYKEDAMNDGFLFSEQNVLNGSELERAVNDQAYLAVCAELKAFPITAAVMDIVDYEEFVNSECEIVVLLVDCSYVDIYCKNTELIEDVYHYVHQKGYTDIEYIDENNSRTKMYV